MRSTNRSTPRVNHLQPPLPRHVYMMRMMKGHIDEYRVMALQMHASPCRAVALSVRQSYRGAGASSSAVATMGMGRQKSTCAKSAKP